MGPVEGLDLCLLVDREHERVVDVRGRPPAQAGVCLRDDVTGLRGNPPFAATRKRLAGHLAR